MGPLPREGYELPRDFLLTGYPNTEVDLANRTQTFRASPGNMLFLQSMVRSQRDAPEGARRNGRKGERRHGVRASSSSPCKQCYKRKACRATPFLHAMLWPCLSSWLPHPSPM